MDEAKSKVLRKLRQIEQNARALTAELPPGEAQNRARLIWGLAAHLVTTFDLQQSGVHPDVAPSGVDPLPRPPR